jgi:ankyrin repeat protein
VNQTKKVLFYVLAFCLFMASGLTGLLAVGGLCGIIWGPEVFESGPPDRSQPYFWVMMVLFAPAMFFGFAAGAFLVVLPLAAWLKIPLLDKSDWRNLARLYKFVKRARCDATEETRQKPKKRKRRTATPRRSRFPRTCRLLRRLAAIACLAAIPFYWWCGAEHICMAGHMQHPPYPTWHVANDVLWNSLLVVAAVAGMLSDFRGKLVLVGLAGALAFSRLGLGSGGILFLLEIVVASALVLLAALNVVRPKSFEVNVSDAAGLSSWARFGRNAYVVLSLIPMLALGIVFWGCLVLAYFLPAMLYQRAVATDDPQTIARLAAWGISVNWRDANGHTALHHAAMSKKPEMCRVLVANGADVHPEDEIQDTPLHAARSAQIAKVLITAGAKVNAKNRFCRTPLNTADGADMRRLLILAGSGVANSDRFGWTPMHDAAKWNNPEIIELLLSRCSPVDPRDGTGATPLHYAASRGHVDVVRLLVARGADPSAANMHGETPRALAEEEGYQEVVDLLEDHGTKEP